MQLKGENLCLADIDTVYNSLLDPDCLANALPGCKSLSMPEEDVYEGVVELGVGPVVGSYKSKVIVEEKKSPKYIKLSANGKGKTGSVTFTLVLHLEEVDGGTEASWEVDAKVSGLVASVGSRVMTGVARFIAKQFFKNLINTDQIEKVESK
ncbi:CoxG family protein [Bacillus sp. Marseille-P3661]|uniref:CoxG family protein n=1 Tax=Bacillus sp. Marseille-P3661 TaxID=1936234 RepID=UPI000C8150A0|nr:carbon monoxide dehydrogenase subunit G [Bacillus sp. Marseille-P3661]